MITRKFDFIAGFRRIFVLFLVAVLLFSNISGIAGAEKTMRGLDLQYMLSSNVNEIRALFFWEPQICNFVLSVREHGRWDYKEKLGNDTSYYCLLDGVFVQMTGEEIGNFHYGYVGSLLFNSWTLKVAGGVVQIAVNSKRNGNIDFSSCDLGSYCDQPEDTEAIQRGIDYYNGKSVYEVFAGRISTDISNVTDQFANMSVKLKSVESGKHVSGEADSRAYADGKNKAGVYKTTLTADGWLGFQSKSGKWLSVQDKDYLRTSGEKLQSWECFRIYKIGDNYYLFSQKNRKFVQVTDESGRPIKAARTISSGFNGATWERFRIEKA